MRPRKLSIFFAVLASWLFAGAQEAPDAATARKLIVGTWSAEMTLPNGIQLRDEQKLRDDGFATGRIVTLFRDGTVKASTSYSFAWRLAGKTLISDGIVRAPPRDDLADSSRDEIVRLDAVELVLRDLSNNIVVSYKRIR